MTVYVRCFAIIVVQENIWIRFETLIFEMTFTFCEYFFVPLCHWFYFHHQRFGNRGTTIGHVPCLVEEKETFLRWFSSSDFFLSTFGINVNWNVKILTLMFISAEKQMAIGVHGLLCISLMLQITSKHLGQLLCPYASSRVLRN